MKNAKLGDWLSLVGTVGVLIGLILVTLELRTTNNMAEAEALREGWNLDISIDLFAIENGIWQLRAKSIERPLDLTDEEIGILSTYLTAQMQHYISIADMRKRYDESLLPLDRQAYGAANDLFIGAFGRAWFYANENWIYDFQPELATAIREEMAKSDVVETYTWPSVLRECTELIIEEKSVSGC